YLLDRSAYLIEKMEVYPQRMRRNLKMTRGLVFSGQLLLDLLEKTDKKGVTREHAYLWVQRNAMKAWDTGADFRELVLADRDIRSVLSAQEIDKAFSLGRQLRNVDTIFKRVFE